MALVWAAGIIWLAVDIATPDEGSGNAAENATDVTGTSISNDDAKAGEEALNSL